MSLTWGNLSSTINVNELTEYIRHQAQEMQGFAQLCNPPTGGALGRGRGDTVQYTYFPNLTTTGGTLSENTEIPEGSLVPVSGSYSLSEYGNAIKLTGKLEYLSRLSVDDAAIQALVDDMRKVQNTAAFNEFDSSSWIATFNSTADEFRTDGVAASFTNVANEQMSRDNLRFLVVKAKNNMIPFFDGESYVYVTGVTSMDALRYDSNITTSLQYDSGRSALNGECGRVVQCRLVEDNHKIAVVGGSSSGAGALLDKGYLVGADAVLNEYALAPEIRVQDKDFGRSVGIAYYFIAAWKKIYNQTSHSKENVIRVVSK